MTSPASSGPPLTHSVVSVQRAAFGAAAERYCEATETNAARIELHDEMLDAYRALPESSSAGAAEYRTVLAVRLAKLEETEQAAAAVARELDEEIEATVDPLPRIGVHVLAEWRDRLGGAR